MYVLIGKEKCNQCNKLKNLLDEKGIQYHYVDVSKIPPELLTYLRMYCNTYPIVLGVKYFTVHSMRRWNGVKYFTPNIFYT
jgi:hypothetical protein